MRISLAASRSRGGDQQKQVSVRDSVAGQSDRPTARGGAAPGAGVAAENEANGLEGKKMKTQKLVGIFLIACLFGCRKPASEQGTNKTAGNKTQTARPLQKAATAVAPITFAPRFGKDGRAPMGQQWFFYDASTHKASTPDGPEVKAANSKNSIIPMRLLSANFANFSVAASYVYKDVLLDLTNFQEIHAYPLAVVQANSDQQLISVAFQGHRNILIDDTYTVFADDSRTVSPDGPFVTIHFAARRSAAANPSR